MLQLSIFLVLVLIVYYVVKPKKMIQVWLSAIIIPLCSITIYGLTAYIYFQYFTNTDISSSYLTGKTTAKCILPTIISGVILFFMLKNKIKNNNSTKLPIILIVAIIISLVVFTIQSVLEYRSEKKVIEYLNSESNYYNQTNTRNQPNINSLEFNGLTFSYPLDWTVVSKKILEDSTAYEVYCTKEVSEFRVVWFKKELSNESLTVLLNNTKNQVQEAGMATTSIYETTFNLHPCMAFDFITHDNIYGKYFLFYLNEYIIEISKLSDTKDKLSIDFKLIEETLDLK